MKLYFQLLQKHIKNTNRSYTHYQEILLLCIWGSGSMGRSNKELLASLNKIPGLNLGAILNHWSNDFSAVLSLLREFVSVHGYDYALLKHSLQIGDYAEVHMLVHKLRGATGMLGLQPLYFRTSELENLLEKEAFDRPKINSQLIALTHELESLCSALKRCMKTAETCSCCVD